MSKKAAQVAREAAQIIQDKGICKGALHSLDGQVCMHGAIQDAMEFKYLSAEWFELQAELNGSIRQKMIDMGLLPEDASWVLTPFPGANYNDLPDTTEKDVAKFLLQVADELEVA